MTLNGGGVPLPLSERLGSPRYAPLPFPDNLEAAKRYFSRLPPVPPGRRIMVPAVAKKPRRCKACHGYNDDTHVSIPMGVGKCTLPHSVLCVGGIGGGRDSKGREWLPCPEDYLGSASRGEQENDDDDSDLGSNMGYQSLDEVSSPSIITSTTSIFTTPSVVLTTTTATVSSGPSAPLFSTTTNGFVDDRAELERLRKEMAALEIEALAVEKQKVSAEKMELQRQLQAERKKVDQMKASLNSSSRHKPETESDIIDSLRASNNLNQLNTDFQSSYGGPNIRQIRQVPGLRDNVEEQVTEFRSNIPSLGQRPSAPPRQTGTKKKSKATDLNKEFEAFKAWRERTTNKPVEVDSESDDSPPPRIRPATKNTSTKSSRQVPPSPGVYTKHSVHHHDPLTSSSEEEDVQPMVLVNRRDSNGVKYRCFEKASQVKESVQWVTDPTTGRQYRQALPSTASSRSSAQSRGHTDHRRDTASPGTGCSLGSRTPAFSSRQQERVPGIIPLKEKEGKLDDRKAPSIVDWAKNCPVTYAEKIKYEEMNLPLWLWAYISEILSSRTGLSPDMPRGELEARLQHLLCVLQVALIHSEKTDFNSKGWSIASIYAKRIQQKLDRGLDTWDSFVRFGHDPHPSEMFAAKTEADSNAPKAAKKKEDTGVKGRGKVCMTWNNCDVERKCQYLVDNPSATRSLRRHECSYCLEKNHGTFNHQRRFCPRRRAAGHE